MRKFLPTLLVLQTFAVASFGGEVVNGVPIDGKTADTTVNNSSVAGATVSDALETLAASSGSSTSSWGDITGTLSNQTDLNTELTNRYTKAEADGLFLTEPPVTNVNTVAFTQDITLDRSLTTSILQFTGEGEAYTSGVNIAGVNLSEFTNDVGYLTTNHTGNASISGKVSAGSLDVAGTSTFYDDGLFDADIVHPISTQAGGTSWTYWAVGGVKAAEGSWRQGVDNSNLVTQVYLSGAWTNAVEVTRP